MHDMYVSYKGHCYATPVQVTFCGWEVTVCEAFPCGTEEGQLDPIYNVNGELILLIYVVYVIKYLLSFALYQLIKYVLFRLCILFGMCALFRTPAMKIECSFFRLMVFSF